jgi:5'-nucleotidase
MKRLLIDMDSVIVNILDKWLSVYNQDYLDTLTVDQLTDYAMEAHVKAECGLKMYDYFHQASFFANLPPIEGAIESLARLHRDFEIVIVSTSPLYAYTDKEKWVEQYLPFIGKRNLVFTHRKDLVVGDLLFDDAPHNLLAFQQSGRLAVAMDYPFNRQLDVPRVTSWPAFEAFVRQYFGGNG